MMPEARDSLMYFSMNSQTGQGEQPPPGDRGTWDDTPGDWCILPWVWPGRTSRPQMALFVPSTTVFGLLVDLDGLGGFRGLERHLGALEGLLLG